MTNRLILGASVSALILAYDGHGSSALAYCMPGPMYSSCLYQQQMEQQRDRQQEMLREQQAEMRRQQQAQQQAEMMRQQQAQQQAEMARQQQAQRQAEIARQQQAQRQAEVARQQQAQRQAEVARQQQQHEQRQAEVAHQQQTQRQAVVAQPTKPARTSEARQSDAAGFALRPARTASQNRDAQQGLQVAPTPIRVSGNTTFSPGVNHQGLTIRSTRSGHSLVVISHLNPNGKPTLVAYRQDTDTVRQIHTRTYLDGHRVTTGPGFVTVATPNRFITTIHGDGRREVSTAGGKPIFRDNFGVSAWRSGHSERVIVRTVFATVAAGTAVALGIPIEEVYGILPYRGATIYPYIPAAVAPDFDSMLTSFSAPYTIDAESPLCPPPVVAFPEPTTSYDDPVDLVGDLVLAYAVQDGVADLAPVNDAMPPSADVTAVSNDVERLHREIEAASTSNAALAAELADQKSELDAMRQKMISPAPRDDSPLRVTTATRQQVRRQVRENIALHQQHKPLILTDIIASNEAQAYVFQVGTMIKATTGQEDCTLIAGDLLMFDQVPNDTDTVASLRVVTSRPESCPAGGTVKIGFADLQDMLNTFSQRMERSIKKVGTNVATQSSKKTLAEGDTP
jgi:hypothetical protein